MLRKSIQTTIFYYITYYNDSFNNIQDIVEFVQNIYYDSSKLYSNNHFKKWLKLMEKIDYD